MAAPPNVWHLRTVADTSSKSCFVCYKPTTAVLITPDNKDFFYICKTHLKDKGFASPVVDEKEEAEKKKREERQKQIELVKNEYEEKQKKKKSKKKAKDGDQDKKDEDEDSRAERERDEKIKAIEAGSKSPSSGDEGPRIFALQRQNTSPLPKTASLTLYPRNFYQMRIDRLRNMESAKRNQQRLTAPSFFPTVPKGDIA